MRPALLLACLLAGPAFPAGAALAAPEPPLAALTVVGAPETVFSHKADACDGHNVPDAPLRAFRDAAGGVVAFGMHHENRALRGETLERVALDCRVVLASAGEAEPAAYDDRSWITATWTEDGRTVQALLHHEYQGNTHPGRCPSGRYMDCWFNTVLSATSTDGGSSFQRPKVPAVVAGAPFGQEVGQGRHRGFFNPSNVVADGSHRFFFAATTGWNGQPHGVCLFRGNAAADPASWRAFDGRDFTVRYADPYREKAKPPRPCEPVAPFPASIGSVVRHRPTGAWLAVFQAKADGADFPRSGFYATSSRDLLRWDTPRLLLAGPTLYDDACAAGGRMIAYPSLLDPKAEGRNFDDVGDEALLFFATMRVEGCEITSDRDLVRRKVAIRVWP